MRVAITGATGFLGTELTDSLTSDRHEVVPLIRPTSKRKQSGIRWDPRSGFIDAEALEGFDAVVNLAGEPIGGHRWTESYKERCRASRVDSTALLSDTLAKLAAPPKVLISGSAVGYYGDRGDEMLTEVSTGGIDFLGELCAEWESATTPAAEAGIRVATVRTGHVLDASRGLMSKLLPQFKLGLGGKFGNGSQYWSWISIDDWIRAVRFLIDTDDTEGAFNLTAPNPVTNEMFTKTLGTVLHRPTVMRVPAFAPALLFGREAVQELLLSGQRAVPEKLQAKGFTFHHLECEQALSHVLGRAHNP